MNLNVPPPMVESLRKEALFCILGHAEPDGDCVGSQVALAHFLSRLGKECHLVSPGPFNRTEIAPFAPSFRAEIDDALLARKPHAIVLDCSAADRIGPLAERIRGLPTLVIDHHSAGTSFGDLLYVDPSAPSVTLLVQKVIEAMGERPDNEESRMLLFGLGTDTGFFRHLDTVDPEVYELVSRLNAGGATPHAIYEMIHAGKSLESRILLGKILARTERHFQGRILYSYERLGDRRSTGASSRDSDTLYQLLQATSGCDAVILVREETRRTCTVGLRANGDIDVGVIAKSFGGGGHRKAAGFLWEGRRRAIKQRIMNHLRPLLTP